MSVCPRVSSVVYVARWAAIPSRRSCLSQKQNFVNVDICFVVIMFLNFPFLKCIYIQICSLKTLLNSFERLQKYSLIFSLVFNYWMFCHKYWQVAQKADDKYIRVVEDEYDQNGKIYINPEWQTCMLEGWETVYLIELLITTDSQNGWVRFIRQIYRLLFHT